MSNLSRPRDGFSFFGKRNLSRKARSRSGSVRRPRVKAVTLVESLETRQLLTASVTTDQQEDAHGSTTIITGAHDTNTGTNVQPGETVHFHIDRTDGVPISAPPAIQDWDVTDGVGGFTPYQDSTGMWWFADTDGSSNGNIGTSWYV